MKGEDKFVTSIDGTRIFYKVLKQDGPWILLQHGAGANHTYYTYEWNVLAAKGYSLIAPDLRNHGYSSIGTVKLQQLLHDLNAILINEGIAKSSMFLSCSACSLGLEYAKKHPEKVSNLWLCWPATAEHFTLKTKALHAISYIFLHTFLRKRKIRKKQFAHWGGIQGFRMINGLRFIRNQMSFKAYLQTLGELIHCTVNQHFHVSVTIVINQCDKFINNRKLCNLLMHKKVTLRYIMPSTKDLLSLSIRKQVCEVLFK